MRMGRGVAEALLKHAREEAPHECCGLLIGTPERIEEAWRARNLEASHTRYRIDPADHFAAIRAARARGLAVVGAYHSHPGTAAVPSRRDAKEVTYPDYLYVIVSLAEGPPGAIRAYRPQRGNFREVRLVADS
jgi:proteasome lid subunit RPN8/RPN11